MADPSKIKEELKAAGVTAYGRLKRPSRLLSSIIREGEHIEAAAYGQSAEGSAMLVATNKRVLYIEANLAYSSSDDFGYGVVSGVNRQTSVLFESVTLYTKVRRYHLTYVNRASAERFVRYIEERIVGLDEPEKDDESEEEDEIGVSYAVLSDDARDFLKSHETMVVSTAARTGQIHSAVVYYILIGDVFYMLTKKDTNKSHDMMSTKAATIVVYDAATKQTAQIQAETAVVGDPLLSQQVFTEIGTVMHGGVANLPIAQLDAGGYIVFSLRPTDIQYHDYGHQE